MSADVATAASRPVRPAKTTVRLRVLIPFAAALVLLLAAGLDGRLRTHDNLELTGPGTTGELHWSNGVFTSRAELRAWLNAHGKSYAAWAKAHPAAVALLPATSAKP
jgi:hypothetical protein